LQILVHNCSNISGEPARHKGDLKPGGFDLSECRAKQRTLNLADTTGVTSGSEG